MNTETNHPKDVERNVEAMVFLMLVALVKNNVENFNLKVIMPVTKVGTVERRASSKARERVKKMIRGMHGRKTMLLLTTSGRPLVGRPRRPNGGDGTIMDSYDKLFVR